MSDKISLNGQFGGQGSNIVIEGRVFKRQFVCTFLNQNGITMNTILEEEEMMKLRDWLNKVV